MRNGLVYFMLYVLIVLFLLSCFITGCFRRYALANNVMDIPNHRSSHTLPTPRGGGLIFTLVFLLAALGLCYVEKSVRSVSLALVIAGTGVAFLGFLDDKHSVGPLVRFLGHISAVILALYWLHGMPSISLGGWLLPAGILLNALAVLYLVWLLNLYNFMDGIDGLAALEAITVSVGSALLYAWHGDYTMMWLPLMLAATVAGFLYWNFPFARLFMGDAGSGFLGLALGILSIQAAAVYPPFFLSFLILLGVFIVDATVTLLMRFYRGCKLYQSHRDHAYQHAADQEGNHFRVTMGVFIINLTWLFPMAFLVGSQHINGLLGLIIAYLPLLALSFTFRSGCRLS